ncbi:hypothetical protein FRX31_020117 [Thalictrum thalictroides]|uniref:Uncharacterized protein n=1 Tax=Thalictrum thalictroides TaxID=46969 RepID=A0A7J6VYU8_THATH|nr:hypothetical protein FRX31_020117 [Thalictrum thalictroides]
MKYRITLLITALALPGDLGGLRLIHRWQYCHAFTTDKECAAHYKVLRLNNLVFLCQRVDAIWPKLKCSVRMGVVRQFYRVLTELDQ